MGRSPAGPDVPLHTGGGPPTGARGPAVLLALLLRVELVAVALAAPVHEADAPALDGVVGPEAVVHSAGAGDDGEGAGRWGAEGAGVSGPEARRARLGWTPRGSSRAGAGARDKQPFAWHTRVRACNSHDSRSRPWAPTPVSSPGPGGAGHRGEGPALTHGAAGLQTLLLGGEVVPVAQAATVLEGLTGHGGTVVEIPGDHPQAGAFRVVQLAGICGGPAAAPTECRGGPGASLGADRAPSRLVCPSALRGVGQLILGMRTLEAG